MLQPLDCEDDKQGKDEENRGPGTEVTVPDTSVADNLESKLNGNIGDDGGQQSLVQQLACELFHGIRYKNPTRAAYLFNPKMRVLGGCVFLLLLLLQPPDGTGAKEDAIGGNRGNPDIDEARRKVPPIRTQGAPAFFIAAEVLARGRRGEIVASQLL